MPQLCTDWTLVPYALDACADGGWTLVPPSAELCSTWNIVPNEVLTCDIWVEVEE